MTGSIYGLTIRDTTSDVKISAKIQLSKVGLAPVPAFSFDSPIVFGFLTVNIHRFSFEPDAAVGLNGRPWMTNYWFRFTAVERNRWKFHVGINPSLFFENEMPDTSGKVTQAQRNLTFEAAVQYKTDYWNLHFVYMNINGCDQGTLSGHFVDVQSELNLNRPGKKILLTIKPELFYFNFDGQVDGLFAATAADVKHKALPLSFYMQGVLPLWADFQGSGFKWNIGISIIL